MGKAPQQLVQKLISDPKLVFSYSIYTIHVCNVIACKTNEENNNKNNTK